MNKIFKKIWNKHRGCFVAVSEAMTSASQRAGKASVVVGAVSLLMSLPTANALTTINGDATPSDLPIKKTSSIWYLKESSNVTGNFTVETSGKWYMIGNTSDGINYADITLNVGGDFYINNSIVAVGHNGDSTTPSVAALNVNGDLYISGTGSVLHLASIGDHGHYSTAAGSLNLQGTMYIGSGARLGNAGSNVTSSFFINNLENSGHVFFESTASGTINNVTQNSGLFEQDSNLNVWIANKFTLNGGSLVTEQPLVVGQRSGNFSIGNSLILGGGSLNQTSLLTQTAGSVAVTAGSYSFGTVNKSNGTLSNAGTLTLTNFNQSGGSASNRGNLTIGSANLYGSLSNTGTLNLTGTVTSRDNLSSSGTLNNRGSWTEANAYTISGNLNNTGSVNFQNGFTLASNSRLTSSGTLQTNNAYNIFDSLGTTGQQDLHYVSLNSTVPQEIKTSLSDFFQKYVAGTVAQDLINHASFSGGKVIITGVNITQTQADDLANAFKSKLCIPSAHKETAHLSTFHFRKVLS